MLQQFFQRIFQRTRVLGLLAFSVCATAYGAGPPIVIGQSAGLTGGQAAFSKDAQTGISAYFAAVNKAGGVAGRPLKLVTEDDGGKRDGVVANTRKLVEETKAFALIGYTSGAGVEAALPYVDKAKVPMLSPLTGNMGIRAQFHRYLFHTRAGYGTEMDTVIRQFSLSGLTRFALVYLDDVGPANAESMRAALKKQKLEAVAAVPISRNSTDFGPQIAAVIQAKPEAVLFITNGPPLAKFVQGMKQKGFRGQFISSSFSGTRFIDDIKADSAGVVLTQVLPPLSRDKKITRDYKAHLKEFDPEAKPNVTSFEAYIAARVLVEGLRRAGESLTRERFVNALEAMTALDIGGYEIRYSDQSREGSSFVDTGVVASDGSVRY